MNKENKQELVTEMHDKLLRAQAVFLADFRGMNVGQATELRNELRKANAEYKVVKNTLLDIASKGTDKEGLSQYYAGPTAIALCYDDPVAAAKVLSRFNKEAANPFTLKAGVLTGKTINVAEIQALADLPSREVLLAKMLGSMQAPASNFVRVLAAVPGGFVRALEQIRVQKAA
ncbi:50S ribosomal protein L10 [Geomonas terrae]|uniref:Large ribosomal subunit protein uL10 n=1 Tax=Geomonas terrae TaxID=2562681 RepID=A0A4S1CAN3_9BACT|nr:MULTISPECIES: 50S ribosomal protein L10 [Geomonas]TGU69986.1 50S ribosomal protein L10 [Geomonas terrae]